MIPFPSFSDSGWLTATLLVLDQLVRAGLAVRVIMRRLPVGVTFAWLFLVLSFPVLGPFIYLMFGELRLGLESARRAAATHGPYREWLLDLVKEARVDWSRLGVECEPMARLTEGAAGQPALPGNAYRLLDHAEAIFRALIADVDEARRTVHLGFYIWSPGGTADELVEAVARAARRGVRCRVLLDAVGSHEFLRGPLAARLKGAGVEVRPALPVNVLRALFVRFDLRMHRKIAVIDGEVAYTGSFNLADPRFFKKSAHVGEWVDAMVRLRGPAVEGLAVTFLEDWELATGEGVAALRRFGDAHPLDEVGPAVMQVAPSGPLIRPRTIQSVILGAIYAARREVVLATPYFVPVEEMLLALAAAAMRGVDVTLIVPARVDSHLVHLASQPFLGDLVERGVKVMRFQGGLLHTKAVTVDGEFSLFGSLNLDPRSLNLNFEITLAVYDAAFTSELRRLLQTYLDASTPMDLDEWRSRPLPERFVSNAARLVSPLL